MEGYGGGERLLFFDMIFNHMVAQWNEKACLFMSKQALTLQFISHGEGLGWSEQFVLTVEYESSTYTKQ